MHPSSINNMKHAIEIIGVKKKGVSLKILDVGGRSLSTEKDRSYKQLFENDYSEYCIADIANGPGVTHIMPSEYSLPFENDYFQIYQWIGNCDYYQPTGDILIHLLNDNTIHSILIPF